MILFITLATTLCFQGCAEKKPQKSVTTKTLPTWYTNPPQSTDTVLYEIGEGPDRNSAVNTALNMLAGTLSVTIASRYRSHISETRRNGRSTNTMDFSNDIQAEIKKIRISNYTVVAGTEQSFRRYLVLIKAEKRDIARGIKSELDQLTAHLKAQEKSYRNQNALKRLGCYRRCLETAADMDNTLLILGILDPAFDPTPYKALQSRWQYKYTQLRGSISFEVESRSALAKTLVPVISEGLSSEQFSITSENTAKHFTVIVSAHAEKATAMGFYLARSSIDIRVIDHAGQTVGSRKLFLIGQSSQSDAIARENVAVKFEKVLKKEGIYALLGLTL